MSSSDRRPESATSAATVCAHAGAASAEKSRHTAPIELAAVMDFPSIAASLPALAGEGHVYRRFGHRNGDELAGAVAALEGAEAGVATSAGMAAIAATVIALCRAGDAVVVQRDVYGGTRALFESDLRRFGIDVRYVAVDDAAEFERAASGARMAVVESIANPLLHVADLGALARICQKAEALLVVDNTFATPLRDRPLASGADIVIHSTTKFLGGHNDLLAGVVVSDDRWIVPIRDVVSRFGFCVAPLDAWLGVRGIRTLHVRMERAWSTAAELARRLASAEAVTRLHSAECCALVTFDVGSRERAERVVSACQLIALSPSLGGVVTTFSHPASSSHRAVPAAEREAAGITDGLLRLSVGLEDPDELWADLETALRA